MIDIQIREDFRKLIPPLAPEELAQLEANIMNDGCRDPLVVWNGILVDGHNRFDICKRRGVKFETKAIAFIDDRAASVWIIRNQFGRRNLAPFTRVELALKLEPMLKEEAKRNQGKRTDLINKAEADGKMRPMMAAAAREHIVQNSERSSKRSSHELAKIAGVSHDTIAKGKIVAEHADEATKDKLRRNQVSVHRVAKDIKEARGKKARQSKRNEAAKTAPAGDDRIIVGDFRQTADAKIKDGSLSLIFTDPPYDREATKMLPALAEFAKRKLAEGGSLVCYVGHVQLPSALEAFGKALRYWWTIACIHSGRHSLMREYGIRVGWKPMLWFVKGTRDDKEAIVKDTVTGGEEKSHHDWQQSESEATYWIENLCPKDGIVCDPFVGGATTLIAAQKLGRKWIGFEIDPDTARIASGRLAQ